VKINEIGGQQGVGIVRNPGRDKTSGADFKALLDDELKDDPEGATVSGAESFGLSGILPTRGVSPVESARFDLDPQALSAVQKGIESLEGLEKAIGGGAVSPKKIDEMVSSLSSEMRGLGASLDKLPQDHPSRQMGAELQVVAHVESVKWKRGDYL